MRVWLLLFCLCLFTWAHDLEENRATLVLRDKTHLSLTLHLNYSEVLHQALLPQREYGAFLMMYSAMPLDELQKQLGQAQRKFEAALVVAPTSSAAAAKAPKFAGWTWPDAKRVQTMLQHQVMQAMVEGHVHEPPVEIRAEAVAASEIAAVMVQFPREFRKVLLVSYRPQQVWVDGGSVAAREVRF